MKRFILLALIPLFAQAGARTDTSEQMVSKVCRPSAPVLVIDTFEGDASNEKNIDLDGDGFYDVHHGEFVSKIVELNGQSTVRHVIPTPVFSNQMLEVLNIYIDKLQRGEVRISWINFSQGFTVEIDSLNRLIGERNKVNEKNVHEYGYRILETLWTSKPKLKLKELYEAFQKLQQLGVPVFVAAANSGYKEVNIYSLFPNVYSVGAIDLDGKKADYSADNSTVTLWRQGNLKSYAVSGGMDLNLDGRTDFSLETPAVTQTLLDSFKGKRAAEVVSEIPKAIDDANDNNRTEFFTLAAKLPKGMYSTYEVIRKTLATPFQQASYIKKLGEYFYVDGTHPRPLFFAGIASNGELIVRQGEIVRGEQFRNVLYGTSFASPAICNGEKTPEQYAL